MKPMLANKYSGQSLIYPVLVQPKLDGIRCIAQIKNGTVTLLSRTGKEILSLPTLVNNLKQRYNNIYLDGELILPNEDFEEICSVVKRKKIHPKESKVKFVIFDVINEDILENRLKLIDSADYVGHKIVQNDIELYRIMDIFIAMGYEGSMIRILGSKYLPNRSVNLLKFKQFNEIGGKILDIDSGKGKFTDLAAVATVETEDGSVIRTTFRFNHTFLSQLLKLKGKYIGKKVDIKYQNKTRDGMLRFPEIIRIREDL